MEDTMAKSLHEYKVQTMIDRETIKRLTKENEVLKTEMKTLQGQLQNQYVRTKELIDEKQEPILGNTKETKT
tara:strand:+ start:523 stop:738 length:216 start_codon:yes stop_codon:yes gene_type:complete